MLHIIIVLSHKSRMCIMYYMITYLSSALGTADAEINVPSFETRVDKFSVPL